MTSKNIASKWVVLILFGLLAALGTGALIGYVLRPQPTETEYTPVAPTKFVQLQPESSDEVLREGKLSADGTRLLELTISYRDGRKGQFKFNENGKLAHAANYASATDSTPVWQGWYNELGTSLVRIETRRADGSLESTFAVDGEGGSERVRYHADGKLASRTTRLPDGSEQSITYGAGASIDSIKIVSPAARQITIGQYPADTTVADSTSAEDGGAVEASQPKPKFRVQLVGYRMQSWDYLDDDGEVLHHGTVEPNGDLAIAVYRWGSLSHVQHWRLSGEDWAQKYYTLVSVEEYWGSNNLYRQIFFYADQKTVRESRLFRSNGVISQVRHFDKQGYSVGTDEFDWDGNFVETRPAPTWYKSSEMVSEYLTAEPGAAYGNPPVYRLRGKAFSKIGVDGAVEFDPLFIP